MVRETYLTNLGIIFHKMYLLGLQILTNRCRAMKLLNVCVFWKLYETRRAFPNDFHGQDAS